MYPWPTLLDPVSNCKTGEVESSIDPSHEIGRSRAADLHQLFKLRTGLNKTNNAWFFFHIGYCFCFCCIYIFSSKFCLFFIFSNNGELFFAKKYFSQIWNLKVRIHPWNEAPECCTIKYRVYYDWKRKLFVVFLQREQIILRLYFQQNSFILWYFVIFLCFSVMFTPVGFFNNPSTQHRTHGRYRPKPLSQRNLVSAFFGLTTVIFIATALVEPRWFRVEGDPSCANKHIGIYKMLSLKSTSITSKFFTSKEKRTVFLCVCCVTCKHDCDTYLVSCRNQNRFTFLLPVSTVIFYWDPHIFNSVLSIPANCANIKDNFSSPEMAKKLLRKGS